MPQFTKRVSAGSRIYFFDVHTDKKGNQYITISELTKATNRRTRVYVHKEDFDKIREAFNESMDFINNGKENSV